MAFCLSVCLFEYWFGPCMPLCVSVYVCVSLGSSVCLHLTLSVRVCLYVSTSMYTVLTNVENLLEERAPKNCLLFHTD